MSESGYRRALAVCAMGLTVCAGLALGQVLMWESAWGAFADDVRAGRVVAEGAEAAARGYFGHRMQYSSLFMLLTTGFGIAGVLVGRWGRPRR